MKKFSIILFALVLNFVILGSVSATTTVYSNATNPEGHLLYGNQMGDDLHMTSGGILDSIGFSIYNGTGYSLISGETCDFRFDFYNGSMANLAGTVFVDDYVLDMHSSKLFSISNISATQAISLTSDIIAVWTWSDLKTAAGDSFMIGVGLGQLIYEPPTIGSSDDTYFIFNGSPYTSALLDPYGNVTPSNFYWEIGVASSVPEPATLLLLGLGLVGLGGVKRKFRR